MYPDDRRIGDFWHPFGVCGGHIDGWDLFHFWLRSSREGDRSEPYSDFSLQTQLCKERKSPRSPSRNSPIIERSDYAYHLDPTSLASLLKGNCLGDGVAHHFDEVVDVSRDENGSIAAVHTQSGRSLSADLFIDCSGKAATLIEQSLGIDWIDWANRFLCDRLLVASIANNSEEIASHSTIQTLESGWHWKIPLSHRQSVGYVYASRFTDQEKAEVELKSLLEESDGQPLSVRCHEFRTGRRKQFWASNCIAIGHAAGYLEPLESTGLLLTQRSIETLLELFPSVHGNRSLTDSFNQRVGRMYDEVKQFVSILYALNGRDDTEYWRTARAEAKTTAVEEFLSTYDECGLLDLESREIFSEPDYFSLLSGHSRLPNDVMPTAMYPSLKVIDDVLDKIKNQNEKISATFQSHAETIRQIHGEGF